MLHFPAVAPNQTMKVAFIQVQYPYICIQLSLANAARQAMRQTWEEIGIDLAEKYYISIGQLDDREITTSLGKRLLMILSPYVFLQVTPIAPTPDPIVTTTLHWVPLISLVSSPKWSSVIVDAASRIAPRSSAAFRYLIRALVGSMEFPAIILETAAPSSPSSTSPPSSEKPKRKPTSTQDVIEKGLSPETLKLWGLSLGMILDLMSYMILPQSSRSDLPPKSKEGTESLLSQYMQLPYQDVVEDFRVEYVAPSLTSVFPKFSYPDVNFWIWWVPLRCFFFRMYVDTDLHLFLLAGYLANDIAKLYVDGKRVCMQEV